LTVLSQPDTVEGVNLNSPQFCFPVNA